MQSGISSDRWHAAEIGSDPFSRCPRMYGCVSTSKALRYCKLAGD